jgi:hypothetical protein
MTAGQDGPGAPAERQPPPGHTPAPPPPGPAGPPPEPMERPLSVRIGLGAFVATLVLGVIALVVQFTDPDGFVDELVAADDDLTEDVARVLFTVGVVVTLVLSAVEALVIWFAWTGRNWARIVLLVLGALGAAGGLAGLSGEGATATSGFLTSMSAFSLVITVVGVVALSLRPSSEWYRHEGLRRSRAR